jgi:hypothetical protein
VTHLVYIGLIPQKAHGRLIWGASSLLHSSEGLLKPGGVLDLGSSRGHTFIGLRRAGAHSGCRGLKGRVLLLPSTVMPAVRCFVRWRAGAVCAWAAWAVVQRCRRASATALSACSLGCCFDFKLHNN